MRRAIPVASTFTRSPHSLPPCSPRLSGLAYRPRARDAHASLPRLSGVARARTYADFARSQGWAGAGPGRTYMIYIPAPAHSSPWPPSWQSHTLPASRDDGAHARRDEEAGISGRRVALSMGWRPQPKGPQPSGKTHSPRGGPSEKRDGRSPVGATPHIDRVGSYRQGWLISTAWTLHAASAGSDEIRTRSSCSSGRSCH